MVMTYILVLAVQQLQVAPFPVELGQEVVVQAMAADRRALANLPITIEHEDGTRHLLGTTDAAGELRYAPTVVGSCCFRAEVDGALLLAPDHVLPPRRRWLYALLCVPLGLALLWHHLRRRAAGADAKP